jgi:predicted RNase H-like HicB family nuclease
MMKIMEPRQKLRFVYWQDDDWWLGYLEEYPDYWTQGRTLQELKENLRDIFVELSGGKIPGVRRIAELELT